MNQQKIIQFLLNSLSIIYCLKNKLVFKYYSFNHNGRQRKCMCCVQIGGNFAKILPTSAGCKRKSSALNAHSTYTMLQIGSFIPQVKKKLGLNYYFLHVTTVCSHYTTKKVRRSQTFLIRYTFDHVFRLRVWVILTRIMIGGFNRPIFVNVLLMFQ